MKYVCFIFLVVLSYCSNGQGYNSKFILKEFPDTSKNLLSEMKQLKTETVLIVNSQAIDEHPMWSPNSDFVACNIMGKWYKFRLTNIELSEVTWRGRPIGILTTNDAASLLNKSERKQFDKVSKANAREVTSTDGTKVELKETGGMSISLIISKKGEASRTLWTGGGENCHSLVLSPDGQFVAYLCEMTGLLVMKLK